MGHCKQLRRRQNINNQLSKSKTMAAKKTVEVWQRPSAENGNAMDTAAVAAKATAEGNGCNDSNGIVDDRGHGDTRCKGNGGGVCCGEEAVGAAAVAAVRQCQGWQRQLQ